jgi:hypothetical protein
MSARPADLPFLIGNGGRDDWPVALSTAIPYPGRPPSTPELGSRCPRMRRRARRDRKGGRGRRAADPLRRRVPRSAPDERQARLGLSDLKHAMDGGGPGMRAIEKPSWRASASYLRMQRSPAESMKSRLLRSRIRRRNPASRTLASSASRIATVARSSSPTAWMAPTTDPLPSSRMDGERPTRTASTHRAAREGGQPRRDSPASRLVSKASPGTAALSAWRRRNRDGARKEPGMARKPAEPGRPRTVGHVSHDALQRVDGRVKEILARREAALKQARRAAQRLKGQ